MKLEEIVPWGRSLDEYQRMFELSPADLEGKILGAGDGPASFNAEMTAQGRRVISVDPLYAFPAQAIRRRVDETAATILAQVKERPERYDWTYFPDADALGRARLMAMDRFLEDYPVGLASGRYRDERLPTLSFADGEFDLVVCSHLLFLYSEHLDLEFHLAALRELRRVAREVRVFPLLGLDCRLSPHLEPVQERLRAEGFTVTVRRVSYLFQLGGGEMLQVR